MAEVEAVLLTLTVKKLSFRVNEPLDEEFRLAFYSNGLADVNSADVKQLLLTNNLLIKSNNDAIALDI
ncbi:hypothetical protein Tcan_14579 [Toxocara canis]|uniref:Uncharacterized protein n=1 Tax=Toxocara canis TaxID=6265 RepID=A0A0B2VXH8_TOXCA|nr:hypothetical protein Tcan_14579 [Toxocara canis]